MANTTAPTEGNTSDGGGGASPPKPASRRKLPLVPIAGGMVALLVAGGAGWWFLLRPPGDGSARQADGGRVVQRTAAFIELPEMNINLAQVGGADRQQFLRMKVSLEVREPRLVPEIQPLLPRVMDLLQVYLRELRPADLEGSAGLYRMREELIRRVNVAVYPARVEAVLFREIVVN